MLDNKLDTLESKQIIELLYKSQLKGLCSVEKILPDLNKIILPILNKLNCGGRLIFAGAGTSGRLAAQEASELFPTFSWPKDKALVLIAGGHKALIEAQEGAEDDIEQSLFDFQATKVTEMDTVICISASGKTPYTVSILRQSKKHGAFTIGICCDTESPLYKESQAKLYLDIEEEVIEGSTRLSSGTAQKVSLNILTTTIMIKLNHVYEKYMVSLAVTNRKLENRGIHMISKICNVTLDEAKKAFLQCGQNIKLSCVYLKYGDLELAKQKLEKHNGNLRLCLEK